MLPLYIGSFLFGGVLLGASVFGGHDTDAGGGHDAGHDTGHGQGDQHSHSGFLPLLSLRFWAFAVAFFGLAGAVLSLAGLGALTPAVAGSFGVGSGYVAARVLRGLSRKPLGLVADVGAHVGREGRLLLPVQKGQRGKLRISVGGFSTDLLAETESDAALAAGDTVLIVGMRDNVALVERNPTALADPKRTALPPPAPASDKGKEPT
jgi:membrane protein implicated in regulation of membrane protease activity